jgi:hypothetical protein
MRFVNQKSAISRINQHGALLVFPIVNRPEPRSLWSEFYPRTKMRWEWADEGDAKTWGMWELMKRLSDCREVVYSKWYQGRATFFSRELFTAMLAMTRLHRNLESSLATSAASLFEILENNSPLSTRELKRQADLQGKHNEGTYNKAMRALFTRLLVIAFGEVDEGSFPSLAVGATRLLYEDLWNAAEEMSPATAQRIVDRHMPEGSLFRRFFDRNLAQIRTAPAARRPILE